MGSTATSAGRAEFERIMLDTIPHLRAFARSLTRNRERADDLTHDAVVRALAAIDQFVPGTNFKAWIFTILRNLYYNEGRKRWANFSSLDDMAGFEPSVEPTQHAHLEFSDFRRAFWQLSEDQREVLILVGASGLSYEEAAVVCGCRVGTVKSRVSRARNELREILQSGTLNVRRRDTAPISTDDIALALSTPAGKIA